MNLRIKFSTIQAWNKQNITDCLKSISRKKNLMNGILKLDKIDLTDVLIFDDQFRRAFC